MIEAGRAEFHALGTGCVVIAADHERLPAATHAVRAELDLVDAACSRFRDDSDLEAVNRGAGTTVPVGEVLIEALAVAQRAAELTDGDLDPTIGAVLCSLGYDRDFGAIDRFQGAVLTVQRTAGWRRIDVNAVAGTVRIPPGASLDLGATAKAWAADRAATAAATAAGCGVLVGLGGDIATAGDAVEGGWAIHVAHDHAAPADGAGQDITIDGGAVATSSTTVRRWERNGQALHHIVDPATSLPAAGVWSTVSVAAATCADANIAATMSIIRGERALPWLDQVRLPARLVDCDGAVTYLNGWPRGGERP